MIPPEEIDHIMKIIGVQFRLLTVLVGDDRQIFHDDQTAAAPEGRLRTVMAVFQDDGFILINAKMGNADLILVHSKKQEEAFVEDGFARIVDGMESERMTYMYNYFVLCGPSADPAGVKGASDVKAAFQAIADGKFPFISRGDGSGTHTKELSLWPEALGITAEAESFRDYTDWYTSANAGMGACLVMAEETGAYILTDKATFLTF